MKKDYAVLLPKTLPQEILALLDGYFYVFFEQNFLLCSDVSDLGYFSELEVLKNDKSKRVWKIKLPNLYILAVADMSDKEAIPIGFLS
jgi:hypothetical protein